jgi:circadian clock protein KaiC
MTRSLAAGDPIRNQATEDRVATGVKGFDVLIEGGFPRGDLVLLVGHPGSGKTLFSSQFLYNGASKYQEPGVYVSFAENRNAFFRNMRRTNMDLEKLEREGLFKFMDFVTVKEGAIDEILTTVIAEVDSLRAKRLVIDSFSAMAQAFSQRIDARIVLHTVLGRMTRLGGVTTLLIAEKPLGSRVLGGGMEEFVSDAVVELTHSLERGYLVRNLDIVKMRGTRTARTRLHYDIEDEGLVVYTPLLPYSFENVSGEKVTTGVDGLDRMLSGGIYKGGTMLVMGESGTGKTTSALQFLAKAAMKNEKVLFTSYEESQDELLRHGKSFGWQLSDLVNSGKTRFMSFVPDPSNIHKIFSEIRQEIKEYKPSRLVVDSLTSLERVMDQDEFFQVIRRLVSLGKSRGITCLATARTSEGAFPTDFWVSSLADVILSLRQVESQSRLRRALVIFKARGSPLDSSIKEFEINQTGITVEDKFTDLEQILGGSARRSARVEGWSEAFTGRPQAKTGTQ